MSKAITRKSWDEFLDHVISDAVKESRLLLVPQDLADLAGLHDGQWFWLHNLTPAPDRAAGAMQLVVMRPPDGPLPREDEP